MNNGNVLFGVLVLTISRPEPAGTTTTAEQKAINQFKQKIVMSLNAKK